MLNSLRRIGASRLHLLAEHGRLQALLDATLAPVLSAKFQYSGGNSLTRYFGTDGVRDYEDEFSTVELKLPEDLSVVAAINPQLRDVILAHQEFTRYIVDLIQVLFVSMPAGFSEGQE